MFLLFLKNISADEWIPEIEDKVDGTPPLIDDLESDRDSEEFKQVFTDALFLWLAHLIVA